MKKLRQISSKEIFYLTFLCSVVLTNIWYFQKGSALWIVETPHFNSYWNIRRVILVVGLSVWKNYLETSLKLIPTMRNNASGGLILRSIFLLKKIVWGISAQVCGAHFPTKDYINWIERNPCNWLELCNSNLSPGNININWIEQEGRLQYSRREYFIWILIPTQFPSDEKLSLFRRKFRYENLITWSASLMKCLLTVVWAENNLLTNKQWTNQCPLYDPCSSDDCWARRQESESPAKYLPGGSQGITSYTSLSGSSTPHYGSQNKLLLITSRQTSIGSSFLKVGETFFPTWSLPIPVIISIIEGF